MDVVTTNHSINRARRRLCWCDQCSYDYAKPATTAGLAVL